jgi:hypothetical protein
MQIYLNIIVAIVKGVLGIGVAPQLNPMISNCGTSLLPLFIGSIGESWKAISAQLAISITEIVILLPPFVLIEIVSFEFSH